MNETEAVPESLEPFLLALLQHTKADTKQTVSMTVVGSDVGLNKASSSRAVEELMALGFVEIRSLSGGIGLTEEGKRLAERYQVMKAGKAVLGKDPWIPETTRGMLQELCSTLHVCVNDLPSGFDPSQTMIDLQTMEIQLTSPKPWTAILRECLNAIRSDLGNRLDPAVDSRIRRLLG